MALMKTTSEIESIRGRFGGVYFKKDNAGQHVVAMPRSIRKASMREPIIAPASAGGSRAAWIGAFSDAAWAWVIVALLFLIAGWTEFGQEWLFESEGKGRRRISGYNWFLHFNVGRKAKKLPTWYHRPRSPTDTPVRTTVGQFFGMDTLNWYRFGKYNGKDLYKSDPAGFYCWWLDPSWIVSNEPGQHEIPPFWWHLGPEPEGGYNGTDPEPEPIWVNY